MESYFNSVQEQGNQLAIRVESAKTQEQVVLDFMKSYKMDVSASFIHAQCFSRFTPLTSVRRALSVLQRRGMVAKTARKVVGPFDHPEFTWKVVSHD